VFEVRSWLSEVRRERLVFTLVVLFTLGLFGIIGAVLFVPDLAARIVGPAAAAHAGQHFRSPAHRIHDLTFSFLFGTAIVGLLAQLRAPSKNVAAQLMALIPWLALALVVPLTNYWVPRGTAFQIVATVIFGGLALSATMLHPAGRHLLSSFRTERANRRMLALVVVAAAPLLLLASTNIGLQRAAASLQLYRHRRGPLGKLAPRWLATHGMGSRPASSPPGCCLLGLFGRRLQPRACLGPRRHRLGRYVHRRWTPRPSTTAYSPRHNPKIANGGRHAVKDGRVGTSSIGISRVLKYVTLGEHRRRQAPDR
jgi:hypothetical protein